MNGIIKIGKSYIKQFDNFTRLCSDIEINGIRNNYYYEVEGGGGGGI